MIQFIGVFFNDYYITTKVKIKYIMQYTNGDKI